MLLVEHGWSVEGSGVFNLSNENEGWLFVCKNGKGLEIVLKPPRITIFYDYKASDYKVRKCKRFNLNDPDSISNLIQHLNEMSCK